MLLLALLLLETLAYDFGPKSTIANPGAAAYATFADMDGDGLVDAVLAQATRQTIGWHKNLGHDNYGNIRWGGFKQITTTTNSISAITVHDVDRDGKPDIIFGVRFQGVYWISMRTSAGSSPYHLTTSGTPTKILVGDVNNDAVADLVIGEADGGRVYYLPGSLYSPYLQSYSDVTILSSGADDDMQLTHIDKDGILDLVLVYRASLKFYTNNGRGRFDLQRSVNVWYGTRVLVADFDHDGINEFLAVRRDAPSGYMIESWPYFGIAARFPGFQITSMSLLNAGKADFVAVTPSGLWWFENNDFGKSFKQHFIGTVSGGSWESSQVFTENFSGQSIRSAKDIAFISNVEFVTYYQLASNAPVSPPTYWPPPSNFVPPISPGDLPYVPPTYSTQPAQWTIIVIGVVVGVLVVFGLIVWLIKRKKQQQQAQANVLGTNVPMDDLSSPPYDPNQTIQPSLIYTGATVPVNPGYGAPPGYFGGAAYAAPPTYSVADGGWVSQTQFAPPPQYPYPPQNNVYI